MAKLAVEPSIDEQLIDDEIFPHLQNQPNVNYDPEQSPPDLTIAEKHGEAARIGHPMKPGKVYKSRELCPCCKQLIHKEKLSILCHTKELAHLGACFPMYFEYIKFGGLLLLISFLSGGIYSIVTNCLGNYCQSNNFQSDLICKTSIMNKLNSVDALKQQSSANFLTLMFMLIAIEYFRRSQRIIARDCQQKDPIPSQYSLMISNLPNDCTKAELEQVLREKKPFEEDLQIHSIYMISNLDKYIQNLQKRQKILASERNSNAKSGDNEELANIENEIKNFREQFQKGERPNFAGKALVILERMNQAKKFRIHYRLTYMQRIIMKFISSNRSPPGWTRLQKHLYRGHFIRISKAAEPSDILWVDISATDKDKFQSRITTYIVMTIILFAVLWILVLFKKLFKQMQQDTSALPVISGSLSFCAAGLVAVTNCGVGVVLRLFVRRQRHSTKTSFFIFVAKYLSTLYFCNIAVITFLANFIQAIGKPNSGQLSLSGLLYDTSFIFLTNPFFSACFTFFDIWHGLILLKRMKLNKKTELFKKTTQAQANAIFENQPCDLALRYANITKTLLVAGFYGVFVPMGYFISIFGLAANYWIDKYLLLRRWTSPHKISRNLGKKMVEVLERYVVVFGVANVIQYILPLYAGVEKNVPKYFENFSFILTLLSLFVSVIYHVVLPKWRINKVIFNVRDRMSSLTYTQAKEKFEETYEMLNPLTREEALQQFTQAKISEHNPEYRKSTMGRQMLASVSEFKFTG